MRGTQALTARVLRRLAVLAPIFLILVGPPLAADVIINEIHYAPRDKTVHEEFVELYNSGSSTVDLDGWHFSDGIDYTFAGVSIEAGGYLVVAQDPTVLTTLYGAVPVVGPFAGRLSNEGETLLLRNRNGFRMDEVDYRRGFPWPTVGGSDGYSIELVHPALDNDLGGSWRAATTLLDESNLLVPAGSAWRYFKGTAEASTPREAWRSPGFVDGTWRSGRAPIGYGEGLVVTDLPDMSSGYSTVYLRQRFEVTDVASIRNLFLEVLYDDGFNAWINGTWVAGDNVPSREIAFDGTASSAREDLDFGAFNLPNPALYLVEGTNVLAVQLHNSSLSGSSDCFLDARLSGAAGGGSGPTPGAPNAVYAENTPPHLRQIELLSPQPVGGEPAHISVKVTDPDGVASVTLDYQVVEPGEYIELEDPAYETAWTAVEMNDDGVEGDLQQGDDRYTVLLPESISVHRNLVRYRIRATDSTGLSIRAPYLDDPVPNFAFFVYDGVPSWSGAIEPGSSNASRRQVVDYSAEIMSRVPAYHLITKRDSTEDCTWFSRYGGDNYLWRGTLVAHGRVYDHVSYRARGGVWRYAMGKNMWKFNFHRGHRFEAYDDFGRRIGTLWDKLNFSAIIQQGDFRHRGEQGLFESTGFKLFNLAGVEAPKTYYVTFRIIDESNEFGPSQYDGDFWGLYLVIEQMDGQFLDEHELPDGNLYKMEGGTGDLNNQGYTAVTDKSDLNLFLSTYQSGSPPDAWWRLNLDLDGYYGYRSIVEAIHHYDIGDGKNYFYYLNPERGVWSVLPWDIDLTWANNMYGNGNEPFRTRVLSRDIFSRDYQNRLREIRDLLFNLDQTGQIIDEFAAIVDDPDGGPAIVDVDRARWDYNPVMVNSSIVNTGKAGHGRFYESAASRSFPGMVQIMKNYVSSRGNLMDSLADDPDIPAQPTVTYSGPAGYPVDSLVLRSSAFSDPQGSGTFAALEWRVAEVAPPGAPPFDPANPRPLEIHATWESGRISPFRSDVTVPAGVLRIGHLYRARARMLDTSGRWSHWSEPIEFTAGAPLTPFPHQSQLRITEIMYHPLESPDAEFIELQNVGATTLDLRDVSFGAGIEFDFAAADVVTLPPGEFVVIVRNRNVFAALYGTSDISVAGEYSRNLGNEGERLLLLVGGNTTILDFAYDDIWYPSTDGAGRSLVIIDARAPAATWAVPASWDRSAELGGSPGRANGEGPVGGRQLPGDSNQDAVLDVSDGLSLLRRLFPGGAAPATPCDGALASGGNLALLDVNDDRTLNVTDVLYLLNHLFQNGPPPAQGSLCLRLEGCPSACGF